jgi:hypothetical protein
MANDAARFDMALELALGTETFESLMLKYAAAVQRGDVERGRFLDERLRRVVAIGSYAAMPERSNRLRN